MLKVHQIKTKAGIIEYPYKLKTGDYYSLHTYDFDGKSSQRNEEKHALDIAYCIMLETFIENQNLEESRVHVKQELRKQSAHQSTFKFRLYVSSLQRSKDIYFLFILFDFIRY